ncbi:hypothetical protein F2Q70_00010940 [Brassica cretica]|uniref:Uncharacterized protein n=1 Tax=Brassica cretica TaxID=69181 RepID=A0A8S9LX84_BRACR|nr:hypothetical protein F2Q70_00010940 [Brassica cretica]
MEDFLELEEFLELEDGEKLEDLDSSREVNMEDFLELEERLEYKDQNSEKKLDDDQLTSRRDLETLPKASIDRRQHDEIDRYPPYNTDRHPPYGIDGQYPPDIDRHPPDCIDRHPWLDELPGYIVELEKVEERMYMSKASHIAVPKHHRPPIWTEEAFGFYKRVKRIHDPVKIVVPCDVFEAESLIPPDKSIQLSSYSGVFDDHICVEASQRRGLRFRGEVNNGRTEAISSNTNKPASIDITTSPSIDTGRESEQNEYEMCGNLFDGETTTRSEKSGGNKKRNWKKRKRPRQPFAKLRALLIAEMIDKGEEYMEEAFTQE